MICITDIESTAIALNQVESMLFYLNTCNKVFLRIENNDLFSISLVNDNKCELVQTKFYSFYALLHTTDYVNFLKTEVNSMLSNKTVRNKYYDDIRKNNIK